MSRSSLRFLRPYLYQSNRAVRPEHARAYLSVQRRFAQSVAADDYLGPHDVEKQKRLEQLRRARPLGDYHPRLHLSSDGERLTIRHFNAKYQNLQTLQPEIVSVMGRIRAMRVLSAKLVFLDIERDTQRLQVMVELKKLTVRDGLEEDFKSFKKTARLGDWISIHGSPTRTSTGQLSVAASEVPQIIAPCLHHIAETVDNAETLARRPHIHALTSDEPGHILRLRALVYDYIRTYFISNGFLEVETPTFDVNAGGAIARPFETIANELSNTPIRLRIAPELNLKRMIIGGQDKIFEIGRVFRNEGVDNTHNPEFSTCEFYEVGATLSDVIARTEQLMHGLHKEVEALRSRYFPTLLAPDVDFTGPFAQLPFIPTIEKESGKKLPDLSSPTASDEVLEMFRALDIAGPPNPTLPRLLDTLAEQYIEPLCVKPTFITHHPEALSPLSKSYLDPVTSQRVASRVELFINGREYVNAYEEENSPFEQRRKFMQQLDFHAHGQGALDESYLEALEWGMPPTGGWGCGLDRLVMLFASKKRIADVLPFGTLRNVVSITKN
ncbi:mitochondrial lysine-tRNA synthetase [Pleosporales sp. CAS-2024a]